MDAVDHLYKGVLIRAEGGAQEPAHLAYDEETQWLAHQGDGVLTLSTPSVPSLERLGHWMTGHWSAALAANCHAAAQWVIAEGHAKPGQIFAKGVGEGGLWCAGGNDPTSGDLQGDPASQWNLRHAILCAGITCLRSWLAEWIGSSRFCDQADEGFLVG